MNEVMDETELNKYGTNKKFIKKSEECLKQYEVVARELENRFKGEDPDSRKKAMARLPRIFHGASKCINFIKKYYYEGVQKESQSARKVENEIKK